MKKRIKNLCMAVANIFFIITYIAYPISGIVLPAYLIKYYHNIFGITLGLLYFMFIAISVIGIIKSFIIYKKHNFDPLQTCVDSIIEDKDITEVL